ncbi:MAG: shikimate kinase [Paracoccaceae bacterium]
MAFILKKTCALVGMMGAGKTAVGTALARHIGVEFRDSDTEIELAANMNIAEIFSRDGEKFFRKREAEVISRLLIDDPCILSTGGGAFLSTTTRNAISKKGVSVWLKADLDLLWARVRHKDTRPLLRTANPRETLRQLCQIREESYRQADLVVNARPDYSINDMAEVVAKALLQRPDILDGP